MYNCAYVRVHARVSLCACAGAVEQRHYRRQTMVFSATLIKDTAWRKDKRKKEKKASFLFPLFCHSSRHIAAQAKAKADNVFTPLVVVLKCRDTVRGDSPRCKHRSKRRYSRHKCFRCTEIRYTLWRDNKGKKEENPGFTPFRDTAKGDTSQR